MNKRFGQNGVPPSYVFFLRPCTNPYGLKESTYICF